MLATRMILIRQPIMLGSEGLRLAVDALALDRIARAGGLVVGDEMMLAIAYQIGPPHVLQCFAQHRPVVRIMVAEERLVQTPLLHRLGDVNRLAVAADFAERVLTGVVHRRGGRHRRG